MSVLDRGINYVPLAPLGFPLYAITKNGQIWSFRRNRFLVPKVHRRGYLFIRLLHESGKWYNRYIHRLVAKMFIPTTNTNLQVDHIDGDKTNNDYRNLRWVTNRENAHFAMQNGLMPHAVFTDEMVHEICRKIANNETVASIAKSMNLPATAIYAIKLKRNWTHISNLYTFPEKQKHTATPIDKVHKICQLLIGGVKVSNIATITGVSTDVINKIKLGKNYTRIAKSYGLPIEKICRPSEQSEEVKDKKP